MSSLRIVGESDTSGLDVVLCNAPGSVAYNPAWYAIANAGIFWDPANLSMLANDNNSGASAILPVLTWAEIIRRFGNTSPQQTYGQNILVNKMSAQANGVDPVFFFPRISGGGYAALVDTLVVFAAASVAGTITPINKAAGTDMTIAGMPAGTTAGMYVFNSTRGGYAFVRTIAAGTATMTQPLATSLVTTIALPTLAIQSTWATGDTIVVYNIPNLTNLKAWQPTGGDIVGANACVGWAQWTQIADTSGSGLSEYPMTGNCATNVLSGVYSSIRMHMGSLSGRVPANILLGCMTGVVTMYAAENAIYAGTVSSLITSATQISSTVNDATLDGNLTIPGATTICGITPVGSVHFIGTIGVQPSSVLQLNTSGAVWGSAGLQLYPMSVYANRSGTTNAVSLLLTGALTFAGLVGTGSVYTGSGVWVDGIAITAGNIDTGGAGGPGIQDPLSGARFCNAA